MGAPSIDGGMTADEHEKLLSDERKYQKEEEDRRRTMAIQDEKDREARAEAERDRLAREEELLIAEANLAEQAVIDEGDAAEKDKEKGKIRNLDFFTALDKGVTSTKPAAPYKDTKPK